MRTAAELRGFAVVEPLTIVRPTQPVHLSGVIWLHTPELISRVESIELRKTIRTLQLECTINVRIGNGQGDFDVSEQHLNREGKSGQ